MQLIEIHYDHFGSFLGNMVQDEISLIILKNLFDFFQMIRIVFHCFQGFVCNEFAFLQQFSERCLRFDGLIFDVLSKLSLTLQEQNIEMKLHEQSLKTYDITVVKLQIPRVFLDLFFNILP